MHEKDGHAASGDISASGDLEPNQVLDYRAGDPWIGKDTNERLRLISAPNTRLPTSPRTPESSGRLSGTERQIDLPIEEQVCDWSFRIAIDAKYHNRRIDVKDVEEFLGLVQDIGAHKGVMVSTEGYSEAAVKRAHADDADLILDALNFKELKGYQGLAAIPHSGSYGAVVQPPFGWIVDGTQGLHALAWLYQRGSTLQEANKVCEFMYINFWTKAETEPVRDLESLFKYQEGYIKAHRPDAQIKFVDAIDRSDAKTAIRLLKRPDWPEIVEYTGFVDFDGFVFMCVLLTPNELVEKNLSKLRFVMRKVVPKKIVYRKAMPTNTPVEPK